MGQQFWFLAVFEAFRPLDVQQGEGGPHVSQVVAQKWSRSGTVSVSPGQPTENVVEQVVNTCRDSGEIPADALLTNINLTPNRLIPR